MTQPTDFRGQFRTDTLARSLYSQGAGIARCVPRAVAVPQDIDDVSALVSWARREGEFVIPRGSGSGMAAGAVGAGIVLDLSRFKNIGDVDTVKSSVTAGSGALRNAIQQKASINSLRFPVDPSSGAFCTIGGMVGTNAAGARSLRFGATRPWVTGLRCVFDDGSQAWIRRGEAPPTSIPAVARLIGALAGIAARAAPDSLAHEGVRKESSGYAISAGLAEDGHLLDLLVGSEGTLVIFTEVELRLIPEAGATATILATFSSLEHATACAVAAREAGATACELLDRTFLDIAATAGSTGVTGGTEAALLIEVEGDSSAEAAHYTRQISALADEHSATDVSVAMERRAEDDLWKLRHAASPILAGLAPRLQSMQFIEDGCVPPDRFPEYVRGVRAALERADTAGVIFGHAGDAHAHVNPLIDVGNARWRDQIKGILEDVCELTARLGGTLTGEHGDGRLRAPLLDRVWQPEALAAFANIKTAGDPSGVLNYGCKVAALGDDGVENNRYDPHGEQIDERAFMALSEIERARAWDRFRLDYAGS